MILISSSNINQLTHLSLINNLPPMHARANEEKPCHTCEFNHSPTPKPWVQLSFLRKLTRLIHLDLHQCFFNLQSSDQSIKASMHSPKPPSALSTTRIFQHPGTVPLTSLPCTSSTRRVCHHTLHRSAC